MAIDATTTDDRTMRSRMVLLLAAVPLAFLLLIGAAVALQHSLSNGLVHRYQWQQHVSVQQRAGRLAALFNALQCELVAVACQAQIEEMPQDQLSAALDRFHRRNRSVVSACGLQEGDGDIRLVAGDQTLPLPPHWKAAIEADAARNSEVQFSEPLQEGNHYVGVLRAPIRNGVLAGTALIAVLRWENLAFWFRQARITPGNYTILFGPEGRIVYHPSPERIGKTFSESPPVLLNGHTAPEDFFFKNQMVMADGPFFNGKRVAVASASFMINDKAYTLVSCTPDGEIATPFSEFSQSAGFLAAAGILISVLSLVYIIYHFLHDRRLWLAFNQDLRRQIQERKDAEQQLRARNTELMQTRYELETIFDSAPSYIFFKDKSFRFMRVNRSLAEATGIPRDEWIGKTAEELFPDSKDTFSNDDRDVLKTGNAKLEIIEKLTTPKGIRWVITDKLPYHDETGDIIGIIALGRDITDRKKAEDKLREREKRFRTVADFAYDWEYWLGPGGEAIYVSPSCERITGYQPEEFRNDNSLFEAITHPDDRARVRNHLSTDFSSPDLLNLDFRIITRNGEERWIQHVCQPVYDAAGTSLGRRASNRDITQQKEAERERQLFDEQLQEMHKLESLSALAGGVAHDFNNLLMGILGNADLAMMDMPEDSQTYGMLQDIREASERAGELSQQMLAYSGKGSFVLAPINLNRELESLKPLLNATISRKIDLVYKFEADLPQIDADASQLRQILMNLVRNASEAIGDDEGTVTISTGVTYCERDYLQTTHLGNNLPPGNYVKLQVNDTGCGMNPETLAKIYDPFFSTKFAGRGLGLAAAFGIIRGHRGAIKAVSKQGEGTQFTVLFPIARKQETAEGRIPTGHAGWEPSGSVLVVDDETVIRRITRMMLERMGFEVLTAEDGVEGVETFRKHADELACVLLDLTMPRMGGEEACARMHEIAPEVPIILASGYDVNEATEQFSDMQLAGFMHKPYRIDRLHAILEEVLGQQESNDSQAEPSSGNGRADTDEPADS